MKQAKNHIILVFQLFSFCITHTHTHTHTYTHTHIHTHIHTNTCARHTHTVRRVQIPPPPPPYTSLEGQVFGRFDGSGVVGQGQEAVQQKDGAVQLQLACLQAVRHTEHSSQSKNGHQGAELTSDTINTQTVNGHQGFQLASHTQHSKQSSQRTCHIKELK